MTVTIARRGLLAGAGALVSAPALAQAGQTRLIVTAAAGGSTDVIARILSPGMSEALGGRPVVVENRGGGGGVIGAEAVANAPPDGTALGFFTVTAGTLNAFLHRNLRYDTRAFVPVSLAITMPMVLTVGNHVPARDLQELVAWMKTRPGRTTYGSAGPGSINHLGAVMLCNRTGTTAEHIPFRGAGPVFASMMAGDTDFLIEGIASQAPFVQQGSLRAIAVTSPARSPALPDVPTVMEQGVPDFEILNWMAFFAPAGTPEAAVRRAEDAARAAVRDPAGNRRLREAGVEPVGSTAEELRAFWEGQFRLWEPVVAASGVTLD